MPKCDFNKVAKRFRFRLSTFTVSRIDQIFPNTDFYGVF